MPRRPTQPPPPVRSLVAWLLVACVLALGSLERVPAAHAWLHGESAACGPDTHSHDQGTNHAHTDDKGGTRHDEHHCVITAFAQGSPLAAPLILPVGTTDMLGAPAPASAPAPLSATDHRLPAGQAPPQAA